MKWVIGTCGLGLHAVGHLFLAPACAWAIFILIAGAVISLISFLPVSLFSGRLPKEGELNHRPF